MEPEDQLQQLRARIIHEECIERWRDAWFWPEHNGVRGWRGTAPIMFVGLNPATGQFPTEATNLLYDALLANGSAQVHLTDLVKVRARVGDDTTRLFADGALLDRQRAYFTEELGSSGPAWSCRWASAREAVLARWRLPPLEGVAVEGIPHFAQRLPTEASRSRFAERMREVRSSYDVLARRVA